jgi:chromosomal replication initiator protein
MMMRKKKDIWGQVVTNLQSLLPKSEFNTWFSSVSLVKCDPGLAVISVPNKFVANWLSDNYLTQIKKSFKAVVDDSPNIQFSCDQQSQKGDVASLLATAPPSLFKHRLNPTLTFEHFIVGEYNRFAHSSALGVAEKGNNQYNPLYIYSPPGLGKTHLLHAIGNYSTKKDPHAKIRYLSSDTFSSHFIYAIKNDKMDEFRTEYRELDLLLLDDIHLLANREKTQEEFLSIFNFLHGSDKQLAITGNSAPNKLRSFSPQLRSRLGSGLLADIRPPDQESKIEIIVNKAKNDDILIPEDVVFFIANSNNDVKNLLNNVVKLETYASLDSASINLSLAKTLMRGREKGKIDLEDIKTTTAVYFNILLSDLVSNKKKRIYSYPRQLAMYLARKHTLLSLNEIGSHFGHKDHSTIIYAIKRIEKNRERNKTIIDDVKKIENLLA